MELVLFGIGLTLVAASVGKAELMARLKELTKEEIS
jgi:hypothetical protein